MMQSPQLVIPLVLNQVRKGRANETFPRRFCVDVNGRRLFRSCTPFLTSSITSSSAGALQSFHGQGAALPLSFLCTDLVSEIYLRSDAS